MASRSIDALAPTVRALAVAFVQECKACGVDVLIYCTLRTNVEQGRLYRIGRDLPGQIVTSAKPGQSLHNPDENGEAWAFDVVPVIAGKPQWSDAKLLGLMGECGEAVGLEWAGRWVGKLRESVHFQGDKNGKKSKILVA